MSTVTRIEWTDTTWNPVTGCTEVSEGCDHCYARTFAERWRGIPGHPYEQGFDLRLWPDRLTQPLRWRKPRRVFVNSMSDLFHQGVPDEFIGSVFDVMARTPQHTYQILTKRPGRMRSLLHRWADAGWYWRRSDQLWCGPLPGPLANVWLGVSVESQRWADIRIPVLLDTPAAVRWLSCEPLLGPVDLTRLHANSRQQPRMVFDAVGQRYGVPGLWQASSTARVDWVVVGGESGPKARPMHPDWARDLRDQCTSAGVAFFFKQWGQWAPHGRGIGMPPSRVGHEVLVGQPLDDMEHRQVMRRVGKRHAGRELDGRTWDQYPAVANV